MLETIIPFAKQYPKKMKNRGNYDTPNGFPKGIIVHFAVNADGTPNDPTNWGAGVIDWGISQGYSYLYLDRDGVLYQAAPINQWGYHGGVSSYPGLKGEVSDECIGIEIAGYGRLTKKGDKFYNYNGKEVPAEEVRYCNYPGQIEGYFHTFTKAQEETLIKTAHWFKQNDPDNFSFDFVLGHDEVAKPFGRKNDPGGSLSLSMPAFRAMLKGEPIPTPVPVDPKSWDTSSFFRKMDEYFIDGQKTDAKFDDLSKIWPLAKAKITALKS